jgi:copper chaperone NosL
VKGIVDSRLTIDAFINLVIWRVGDSATERANRQITRSLHRQIVRGSAVLLLLAILCSCEQRQSLEPPVIYFGQHECDVCRMIISDERYAAAALVENERGRLDPLLFDDIGCLFQYEQDEPDERIAARFVRDAQQAIWLDLDAAVLLHSRTLQTPMAFHLAALQTHEQAQQMQQEHPGDLLDLEGARRRFEAGTLRSF